MEDTILGRVTSTICLRGKKFPAGVIVRIWKVGETISIQPFHVSDPVHKVLWYSIPKIHFKHINILKDYECALVDLGFL